MTVETLGADSAQVTPNPEQAWDKLLLRLNELEAIPNAGMDEDAYDALIDEAGDLAATLMAMPAPSAAALRWKLDYVLAPSDCGSSDCHSAEFLRQTITDYRHLLGGVALAMHHVDVTDAERMAAHHG